MLNNKIQQDGKNVLGFVIGEGTGDFNVGNMIEHIVITQLATKKYNVAVVLTIVINRFDIN